MHSLEELPSEVLCEIVGHLGQAKSLRCLALTCRALCRFVGREGWKTLVHARFPSIAVPHSDWSQAAHALTTLSRNFDRRAFLAREISPTHAVYLLPEGTFQNQWHKPVKQSMGYQAVVDSHEQRVGNRRSSRKEVVAWGAGADLVIRSTDGSRSSGVIDERQRRGPHSAQGTPTWYVYRDPACREGRDDITSLHLVRPAEDHAIDLAEGSSKILVGTASGNLRLLHMQANTSQWVQHSYATPGVQVRSVDISSPTSSLIAASFANERLAVYPLLSDDDIVHPASEIEVIPEQRSGCRTWALRFISNDLIAVGRGPAKDLVRVYKVERDGLRSQPVRNFALETDSPKTTSVYPLVNLPATSQMHSSGLAFLSGGYDGLIRQVKWRMKTMNPC